MKNSRKYGCSLGLHTPAMLAFLFIFGFIGTITSSAEAQSFTYQMLYSFAGGSDAQGAFTGLTPNADANLYGTSPQGGAFGSGAVYKLDFTGDESLFYSFSFGGAAGANPEGGLVFDALGNLYGTTSNGSCSGCGTVFKLDPYSNLTVLHTFTGTGGDGVNPSGDLVLDSEGNIYGTAAGGVNYGGIIFKLTPDGDETILYSLSCCDIGTPNGLVMDAYGNLFGTTMIGGSGHGQGCGDFGCGTVFELTTTLRLVGLHDFDPSLGDGGHPNSRLVIDSNGNLYGTTYMGGYETKGRPIGSGIVFQVNRFGSETVLHEFCSASGGTPECPDGRWPDGGLVRDSSGNLYGTTKGGGIYGNGTGTVFMIDTSGNESTLYNFQKSKHMGDTPITNLALEADGNLYGTTSRGGANDLGVIFGMLLPAGSTTTTLSSTPNPSTSGETVTFTAIVSSSKGAPPDGETVSFLQGKTVLGTGALSGGSATFTTSILKVGITKVTAQYNGDPYFIASVSNTVEQVVKKPK